MLTNFHLIKKNLIAEYVKNKQIKNEKSKL